MTVKVLVIGVLLMLQGCSDKDPQNSAVAPDAEPQHVWKDQVKAIDKAKSLEQDINAAFKRRAEGINTQSR